LEAQFPPYQQRFYKKKGINKTQYNHSIRPTSPSHQILSVEMGVWVCTRPWAGVCISFQPLFHFRATIIQKTILLGKEETWESGRRREEDSKESWGLEMYRKH
jgi:hypothetical protein